jgi:hypothetical protein
MARPTRIIEAAGNDMPLLARFVRAVTNHAPTGEYRRRWHPECPNTCPHDRAIHTRRHILTECGAYARVFTTTRELLEQDDSLIEFINFLKNNNGAFSFEDAPYEPP